VVEVDLDGERLVCCHATPTSNTEIVLPESPRNRVATLIGSAAGVVGGHVHLQWLRRVGRAFWACAGSVGLVVDNTAPGEVKLIAPWAEYAVASGSPSRIEFRRVQFETREVVGAIRASGIPDAERLAREWPNA
jgi:hypothetical protein